MRPRPPAPISTPTITPRRTATKTTRRIPRDARIGAPSVARAASRAGPTTTPDRLAQDLSAGPSHRTWSPGSATSSTSLPAPQPSARSTAMAACGAGATRRPAMPTACVGVGPVWPRPRRSPVSTGQRPSASSSSATPRPACVASPAQLSASTTGDTRAWRPSRASTASSGPARARSVIWREFHCGP